MFFSPPVRTDCVYWMYADQVLAGFSAYERATGAKLDETTGLLLISQANFNKLGTLNFNIGGVAFGLTPNAQLFPRALNTYVLEKTLTTRDADNAI